MVVGQLKEIVLFEFNYPTDLGAGKADAYYELLTTRGYLKKRSGQRSFETGEVINKQSFELWIRYAAYLESHLRTDLRITINGKVYTIDTWEKIEEKNFYFKFIINQRNA